MGAFEAVAGKYEAVKKSVQEKWAGFKQKFEGTKTEMSQEVLNAKSPEDLIATGKKLQEQGEALQLEEDGVKQEESQGESLESEKNVIMGGMQVEGDKMNVAFDENKAAEEAAKETARIAEEDRTRAENEAALLVEARAKLVGAGDTSAQENADLPTSESILPAAEENKEIMQEKIEDIFGMSSEDLVSLLDNRGYPEKQIQATDPDFEKKMEQFHANQKSFGQAEVKLFDRVLAGKATEEEMIIAENHATKISKNWGLAGFHSIVPKAWYTNERIVNALASARPINKEFIDNIVSRRSKEELLKEYRVIGEDGWVHTYERK